MHVAGKNFFETARFIDSAKTGVDITQSIDNVLEKKPEYVPFDDLLIKRLNNQVFDHPRAMRYFEARKISEKSINKFLLGYSENQDMITIPMNDPNGKMFVGFVARSVEGKDFKNTPKLPKSKILFNLHRARMHDTVYVVESSFDAIRLDQCDLPSVATLGSNVSRIQVELLTKYFNNVIVVPDNDDAGADMARRITEKMGPRATAIRLPQRFKDIGDMTDSDIHELSKITNNPLLSII